MNPSKFISRSFAEDRSRGSGPLGCLFLMVVVLACAAVGGIFIQALGTAGSNDSADPQIVGTHSRRVETSRKQATTHTKKRTKKSQHYDVLLHPSCTSSTGTPTTCTLYIRNAADSTASFSWSASSNPPGARFTPSSGTVARGATTGPISVTIPLSGVCPVEIDVATAGGFVARDSVTTVNGKGC